MPACSNPQDIERAADLAVVGCWRKDDEWAEPFATSQKVLFAFVCGPGPGMWPVSMWGVVFGALENALRKSEWPLARADLDPPAPTQSKKTGNAAGAHRLMTCAWADGEVTGLRIPLDSKGRPETLTGALGADFMHKLRKEIDKRWPGLKGKWVTIGTDNCPVFFRSTASEKAQAENKMRCASFPVKSPDLQICDYFLHAALDKRVSERVSSLGAAEKRGMTKEKHWKHVEAVLAGFTQEEVMNAENDLFTRADLVVAAEGWHIKK